MERPEFDDWVAQRGAALLRFAYLVTHALMAPRSASTSEAR